MFLMLSLALLPLLVLLAIARWPWERGNNPFSVAVGNRTGDDPTVSGFGLRNTSNDTGRCAAVLAEGKPPATDYIPDAKQDADAKTSLLRKFHKLTRKR